MKLKKLNVGWLHQCNECGKEFKGRAEAQYCSSSCSFMRTAQKGYPRYGKDNPNWRGGKKVHWNRTPQIAKARDAVGYQVLIGKLIPQPCELCGNVFRTVAHHEDYDKPLDINWLCCSCHRHVHTKMMRVVKVTS